MGEEWRRPCPHHSDTALARAACGACYADLIAALDELEPPTTEETPPCAP